jgi:signal transduction histidine kinase
LYISKMIIENSMNGRLTVKNTDQGVRFIVEVPI